MNATISTRTSLARRVELVFGEGDDSMADVEARALRHLPEYQTIVWEADAGSLECTYIGASALPILRYPLERWTGSAGFWAEMIHPEDRDEALANCALCAGRGRGHNFAYRAITAEGEVHHFFNVVRTVRGPRGLAVRLRGILFDVTQSPELLNGDGALREIAVQPPDEILDA